VSVPVAKDCRFEPRPCRGTNSQALSHLSRVSRETGDERERGEREREGEGGEDRQTEKFNIKYY